MNKKISLGAAIAFMAIVAAATFSVTMVYAMRDFNDKVYSIKERETMYSKIAEIDGLARQNFIGTIGESELMDNTAAGFIAGLGDAYAQYFDAASYVRMLEDFGGETVQIGIVTKMDTSGYIKVSEVYPDSPALAAGIEVNDLIVKIDETDITKENYDEAVAMLTGAAGTQMNIIVRKGVEESTLNMTRRFVEIPSVSSVMLENSVGLVRVKEFNDNTPEQFSKQVDALVNRQAAALIFDVREVSVGTLRSVAQVLDKLLPEGVIASSTDKNGKTTVLEMSDAGEIALPMAVLANENTSGEAELFAQSIKDYGKGKVVGIQTKGKGTMQTTFPLTDGSAIKLTTAKYTPKGGVSYDGVGVKADYEVKMGAESIAQTVSAEIFADLQLKKALEVAVAAIKTTAAQAGLEVPATVLAPASSAAAASSETSAPSSSGEAASSEESSEEASANESSSEESSAE